MLIQYKRQLSRSLPSHRLRYEGNHGRENPPLGETDADADASRIVYANTKTEDKKSEKRILILLGFYFNRVGVPVPPRAGGTPLLVCRGGWRCDGGVYVTVVAAAATRRSGMEGVCAMRSM
ncbi:hypothetical protein JR316_0010887 [Psilocybe cubensis]|uniref:Uncharacterized protein n=1 Tax=Psilocybe cubensis TaxID=181762 RepID=A0ACB8GN41_PSICU|nr:hypothetical protein JR316_0010887 [Psilocybe cubensis]KAH9476971.1 hypothetical protein JR316_0010887 [Psilocybe cubensis]